MTLDTRGGEVSKDTYRSDGANDDAVVVVQIGDVRDVKNFHGVPTSPHGCCLICRRQGLERGGIFMIDQCSMIAKNDRSTKRCSRYD